MDTEQHRRLTANFRFMQSFKPKGSFNCRAHPQAGFCTCRAARTLPPNDELAMKGLLVLDWEEKLLTTDDCFLYTGADSGSAIFHRRTGKSTLVFATLFLDAGDSQYRFFVPTISKAEVVKAMLAFWADRVGQWRKLYTCKEQARQAVRRSPAQPEGMTREISYGPEDHRTKVRVMPMLEMDGSVSYQVLETVDCHEECGTSMRDMDELQRLLAL